MPVSELWIGTSGWHYKHWVGNFYPERLPASQMLPFYQRQFNTVELNNTFYRLPSQPSLEAWRDETPKGFRFAAKGSRFLTHMKKLNNPEEGLKRYLAAVETLGHKLGPILFQLPPNWEINLERLSAFLKILPEYHRYVFEFRNPTWNTHDTYRLLRENGIAYCIFDLAGYQSPNEITADFAYVRLHGPGGKYQGSYSEQKLEGWARTIDDWSQQLSAVYVYFDNDDSGYAPQDALRLKGLIHPLKNSEPLSELLQVRKST